MAAALEQPKKPAGGAYGRFMAEKRAEFAKQCAGKPVSAVSKLGGEEWKKLDETQKAPYQKQFEEAQKKYSADMEAFLAAGGVKTKGAAALRTEKRKAKEGKKAAKDPNRPKKPAGGAFGVFLAKNRAAFQKECPGAVTAVTKHASAKWKELSETDKKPYQEEFEEKQAAYKKAMESYTPPAGAEAEAEEEEEDGEDEEEEEEEEGEESPPKKAKKEAAPTKAKATEKEAPKAKGKGRGRGAAKAEESPDISLPKGIQDKADAKGYTATLVKLLGRNDIQEKGVSATKALEALDTSNGLLHAAKRALLGA